MVGHEIHDEFHTGGMDAIHQSLELCHSVRNRHCQVRIYVIIVTDSVGRTCTTFYGLGV